jgi:hypothetical protein
MSLICNISMGLSPNEVDIKAGLVDVLQTESFLVASECHQGLACMHTRSPSAAAVYLSSAETRIGRMADALGRLRTLLEKSDAGRVQPIDLDKGYEIGCKGRFIPEVDEALSAVKRTTATGRSAAVITELIRRLEELRNELKVTLRDLQNVALAAPEETPELTRQSLRIQTVLTEAMSYAQMVAFFNSVRPESSTATEVPAASAAN